MLHGHIKQGLRLNRAIGYSFLFYGLFQWLTAPAAHTMVSHALFGATLLLSTLFLISNQGALKLIKRFPEAEEVFLEKFGILSASLAYVYTVVSFFLTGQLEVFCFILIPVLQAQFYGHHRLAKTLFGIQLGILMVSLPFQQHLVLEKAVAWHSMVKLIPLLFTTFQFGSMVSQSVRSTTSQMSRLQSLAATDGLTGLINRRQFNHQLNGEISRARRHHAALSLALFDIDNFKKLNDVYGHPMGDRILKELGALIAQNVRECDIPARYGGEEFALILPETRLAEAYEILERLRNLVEKTVFCLPDNPLTISISVGVAQLDWDRATAFELVEKSDAALYEAKKQGKNRVVYGVVPPPKLNFPEIKPLSSL